MLATYNKTIFENGDFSVCTFIPDDESELPENALKYGTFVGIGNNIPHSNDIQLMIEGEWKSTKYGLQMEISSCISVLPKTEEGIIEFLSSGVLPHIKRKMAVRLYNAFGEQVFSILENNPDEWLKVRGITKKKLEKIKESYTVNYGYQDLVMLLAPFGISVNKIKKIVDKFGAEACEKVSENPYLLFTIKGFGFKTVDEIAGKMNTPKNDPLRIRGALEYVLAEAEKNGHLCLEQEILRQQAYEMLNEGMEMPVVTINDVTNVIIQMAQDKILKGDNGMAYLANNYDNEVYSAKKIRQFLNTPQSRIDVSDKIVKFEKQNFPLADRQKEAIKQFFNNRFSIITGGPGTGKSTVLKAILEINAQVYEKSEVLLLAPTGKAARRMAQATGKEAYTIHSGLRIMEDTDISSTKNLEFDTVIVDEVSMCDMKIFSILMSALNPDKTTLLLVGDSDQLPSVGAGNVLNELISCGKIPITRLNLVYRQGAGSVIPQNAELINNGNSRLLYNSEFQFINADEQDSCFELVVEKYVHAVKTIGIENVCILCPMKSKGVNCVNEYNKVIQQKINPPAPDKLEMKVKTTVFRQGDRVMQTKNNEFVSNGETGIIVSIEKDEDEELLCGIKFDGKHDTIWYDIEDMSNITLAYSITIHKSQGSEYKTVIMPMMKSFFIMLKRNLLYTAVTRAKSKVIIVGQKQAIFIAVNKTETDKRNTQLGLRI